MEAGEPEPETLFEDMKFDEAMNAVGPSALHDDPEMEADHRRFLRMAALIQECARITKETACWVHRSKNSQAQVAARVKVSFDAYNKLQQGLNQSSDGRGPSVIRAFKESLDIQIPIGDDGQPLLGDGTNLPRSVGCSFQITEVLDKFTQVKWSGDGSISADKRDQLLNVLRDTKGSGEECDYPAIIYLFFTEPLWG